MLSLLNVVLLAYLWRRAVLDGGLFAGMSGLAAGLDHPAAETLTAPALYHWLVGGFAVAAGVGALALAVWTAVGDRALGRAAESFAYPNGDTTPALARAVADAGYQLAVVTDSAPIAGCPAKFALQRKNLAEGSSRGIAGFSASIFACEVLGLFDAIRSIGRRRRRR